LKFSFEKTLDKKNGPAIIADCFLLIYEKIWKYSEKHVGFLSKSQDRGENVSKNEVVQLFIFETYDPVLRNNAITGNGGNNTRFLYPYCN
jgi:hypothetical protein